MDKLSEILESGIRAKRMGNYNLALECYEKAREISPLDKRIFGNILRIFIGLEKYEDALRNLLIICSNNRLDRLIETDMKDPIAKSMLNEFKGRFHSTSTLYKKDDVTYVKFEPELILNALEEDDLLNDLIFRADNLTYYIGHSFIGLNPSIISTHNIPLNEFRNLNNALLGNPTGNDLRQHESSGLFLCIGFIFAHMNLKENINTKEKIVSYFLDKQNLLDFEIENYRAFLSKKNRNKPKSNIYKSYN
jgi:tetratricopeptide (TPR) repeat protein